MNDWHFRLVISLACLAALWGGPAYGRDAGRVPARHTGESTAAPSTQIEAPGLPQSPDGEADLIRDALRQNEYLRLLLEQTRRELLELRQEVNQLRSSVVALQPAGAPGAERSQPPTLLDSDTELADRLMRVEDQVEIHASQIREQAQTKVESDSRFKVRLFGTVLYNSFFNTHDTAEAAVPTVAPASSVRVPNGGDNFGATLRQTSFGFAMTGPRLGDARLSADVDFDFYGGAPGVYGTDVLGALRMRTAMARLDGNRTSLALGLMSPMISPLSPNSLAAVYYPAFGDSGNLWQWLPQVTLEHRMPVNESGGLVLQGGLMMPFGENFYGKSLEGKPGYESRVAFAQEVGSDKRREIGIGGYIHPRQFGFGRTIDSYAMTADWLIPVTGWLDVSGESYYGQSITLRSPSGGDISDLFAFSGGIDDPGGTFRGIHSAGGWIQLRAQATPKLEFNAAYGIDDPRNRDIFAGLVRNAVWLRNRTFSLNSIYQLRSNFLVSLEYRRLSTVYPDASRTNDHFNLAIGYLF
jgi:hypothetical protein